MKRRFSSSMPGSPAPARKRSLRLPSASFKRDAVGKGHVHRPVALPQHRARLRISAAQRLLLLLGADQLALVRLLLDDAAVVDRHRHEVEIAAHAVDEGADDRRQHAELRREDLSGPAAPAFDEELLRVALADQEGEVLAEHRLVELVALEAAADEVGAGAAEQRPERPERQVDPGGDVRRAQVVGVEQVRQDQVVEVAAMARHQHDRVLLHAFHDVVQAAVLEALEDARPDAVEQRTPEGEVDAVVVRRHLVEVPLGRAPQPRLRLVALQPSVESARPDRHLAAPAGARAASAATAAPTPRALRDTGRFAAPAPDGARCARSPSVATALLELAEAHLFADDDAGRRARSRPRTAAASPRPGASCTLYTSVASRDSWRRNRARAARRAARGTRRARPPVCTISRR